MYGELLMLASWLIAVPLAVVGIECLAALIPRRRSLTLGPVYPRLTVIVPAHDEATGIAEVLKSLSAELKPQDRLLVVADNCSDNTAEIARAAGACVIERNDPERRGKGYALDFAIRHLEQDPPDVVVIVDADCQVSPRTIAKIAEHAALSGQPAQALYRFDLPSSATIRDQISAFAVIVRNVVRPLGANQLGIACTLQGSGMAFPWRIIKDASLAHGNIVEDMQLGIDLAIARHPAQIVEGTLVQGRLPQIENAKRSQRTRWEHGHLSTMITQVPRLVRTAFAHWRWDLLGLALDLAVPPLALLVAAASVVLGLSLGYGITTGDLTPLKPCAVATLLMTIGIICAQLRFAHRVIELRTLLLAPIYIAWKLPIYGAYLWKRQSRWVRTARDRS